MFKFQSRTAFWNATRRYFTDSDLAYAYFFDGTIPNTMDDIPFDTNDMFEVFGNCKYAQQIYANENIQINFGLNSGAGYASAFTQFRSLHRLGKPRVFHVDPKWNKWILEPKNIIPSFYIDGDTKKGVPGYEDTDTELRNGHFAHRYSERIRGFEEDEEEHINGNFSGTVVWGNRSAQTSPWIIEYDQEVTIDSFEYKQWSSSNNNPNTMQLIEYWDQTLNGGSGDWVVSDTAFQLYDHIYPQRSVYRITPMTSTRFRFTWGDTGSSSFAVNSWRPMGPEPTWGKDPVNLTWALIGGNHNVYNAYFNRNRTESFGEPGGYPFVLVDVSDTSGDGALKLDRATGLDGTYSPLIQNLIFQFKD